MLLFGCTTVRLVIENFTKYGIKVNPKTWVLTVVTPEGIQLSAAFATAYHCKVLFMSVMASSSE